MRTIDALFFLAALFAVVHSYETHYVDDNGADCLSFGAGDHEFDVCHGRFSYIEVPK